MKENQQILNDEKFLPAPMVKSPILGQVEISLMT
jgi:hypothetical protein